MILPVTAATNGGLCGQCFLRARTQSPSSSETKFYGKYDDTSWHSGGDFPKDLPPEAGATHTGMFLVWGLLSGLAGEFHGEDSPEGVVALRARSVTPGAFFIRFCDGKFTDEDFSNAGNSFALKYYDFQTGKYLSDYCAAVGVTIDRIYYAADTWENFERLRPVLDKRFAEWKTTQG